MKMIVGLGNPGKKYAHTRHNVGFDVLDALAVRGRATFRRSWRFPVQLGEIEAGGEKLLLVKPQTYMNRSGEAVAALGRKKGVAPADVIVVVDDVELDCGQLRIRRSGSAGKHNGLQSVIDHLGTNEFARLRVGVGRVPAGQSRIDYVLSRFRPEEQSAMRDAVARGADAVLSVVEDGLETAMNRFNG
jgi:PTH1 family peptidyl-tRNA hydrolase